ncbi:MAG TPA: hypothetical protein VGD54_19705 [Steroidobacteraceae bacterium]
MKYSKLILLAAITVLSAAGLLAASTSLGPASADGAASPIYGIAIQPGYRDWKLISVAHEAGNLNDIRAILGNDIAIKGLP